MKNPRENARVSFLMQYYIGYICSGSAKRGTWENSHKIILLLTQFAPSHPLEKSNVFKLDPNLTN